MIAKCGEINIWHWAHKTLEICDSFSEGETDWHIQWKQDIDPNHCEVVIQRGSVRHIADIVGNNKMIIELQHSPISPATIRAREQFYEKMIWVFDANEYDLDFRDRGNYYTFRWKHPRKSLWHVTKPMFWDITNVWFEDDIYDGFGVDMIFRVRKIYHDIPCGGWGHWIPRPRFDYKFLNNVKKSKILEEVEIGRKV